MNLLRLLRGNLRGVNLSSLAIRQAYLQVTEAQDADLADSYVTESILAESFDHPSSMAISGNGAFIAVGTSTGEIFVWRVADRILIASLRDNTTGVWGLALSEDGRHVVSSNADGVVRLWDIESASPLATFEGHRGGVVGIDLRPDGEVLISSGNDGTVNIWDARRRRLLTTFEGKSRRGLGADDESRRHPRRERHR